MGIENEAIAAALPLWGLPAESAVRLVNHSENHTFLVTPPVGPRVVLRVHRPGYQSLETIRSELAWLEALRADTGLPVPAPIPGCDGELVQRVGAGETGRAAVMFAHLPGREPGPDEDLTGLFKVLGRYAAVMHRHAAGWRRPEGFARQVWSADRVLDADGLWGDWRVAPGVDEAIRPVLEALDSALRADLAVYGAGPDRFGLIHADMRLGNVLVSEAGVALIDFDDMGLCWFAYDFAAAVSFHETELDLPALKAAWLEGYLPVRALTEADIKAMDTMVLLRRMALLAWIGSHGETPLAARHREGFAQGTQRLAEAYLRTSARK